MTGSDPAEDALLAGGRFYRGTVIRVRYGSGTGLIRSGNGRRIPFEAPYVVLSGASRIEDLTEGMEVGFDVGWTSRGLRVTLIKVYGPEETAP